MNKFEITTDSNCDLYAKEYEALGVERGKLSFTLEENGELCEYLDEFTEYSEYVDFYNKLRKGGIAKTTILNLQAHIDLFEKMAKNGVKNLLHITQSSGLSPTIDNANKAIETVKESYPDINYIAVDSLTTTVGEQMLVKYACKLRDNGENLEKAVQKINDMKGKVQHFIIVGDLMYIKRGGRISGVSAAIGSMLSIKPIIEFTKKGKLEIVRKEMGAKKAYRNIIDGLKNFTPNKDYFDAIIVHTDNEEQANIFAKMVAEATGWRPEIRIMGPIIGAHVGPGAVALAFVSNEERKID